MEMKTPNYSSIARSLASQWGDVNCSYKTTQQFAYYFSCSGHGGYIIVYDKLTDDQKNNLIKWYGGEDKIPFITAAFDSYRGTTKTNAHWREGTVDKEIYQNLRFLNFEEDCEWAVATGILKIRLKDETVKEYKQTLKRWYPEKYENYFGKEV